MISKTSIGIYIASDISIQNLNKLFLGLTTSHANAQSCLTLKKLKMKLKCLLLKSSAAVSCL